MSKELPNGIAEAAEWLHEQISEHDYGEAQLVVKIHKGRPTLLERSFTEKIQMTGITGGSYGQRKN